MYTLDGVDGNAYAIMAYVKNALDETGRHRQIETYLQQAMWGSYSNLVNVSQEYLNEINNEE